MNLQKWEFFLAHPVVVPVVQFYGVYTVPVQLYAHTNQFCVIQENIKAEVFKVQLSTKHKFQ